MEYRVPSWSWWSTAMGSKHHPVTMGSSGVFCVCSFLLRIRARAEGSKPPGSGPEANGLISRSLPGPFFGASGPCPQVRWY